MSWKVIDDRNLLHKLKTSEIRFQRTVFLSKTKHADSNNVAEKHAATSLESAQDRTYEIYAYDTMPPTAVVHERDTKQTIGSYVWCGNGGKIHTARDRRMVYLADLLDCEFHGCDKPSAGQYNSEDTCSCCRETYDTIIPDGENAIDEQIDPYTRLEKKELTPSESINAVMQYATDIQLKEMERLTDQGYEYTGNPMKIDVINNIEKSQFLIPMFTPNDDIAFLMPDGTLD